MNCKKFEYWLTSRDIHEKEIPPEAWTHMEGCDDCRRLFEKDSLLEQCISHAFQPEPAPREMARRINTALDRGRGPKAAPVWAALAACIALALFFLPDFRTPPRFEDLGQFSLSAAAGHLAGKRHISYHAHQTDQALSMLTKKLGFRVILPAPEQLGCTVLGCRLCAVDNCRAAYFAVERDGRPGSLFIMDTDHLKFPMDEGIRFNCRVNGCDTSIWKAHGQIYAMIF